MTKPQAPFFDDEDDDGPDEELPPGHPQREYVNKMLGFDPALENWDEDDEPDEAAK